MQKIEDKISSQTTQQETRQFWIHDAWFFWNTFRTKFVIKFSGRISLNFLVCKFKVISEHSQNTKMRFATKNPINNRNQQHCYQPSNERFSDNSIQFIDILSIINFWSIDLWLQKILIENAMKDSRDRIVFSFGSSWFEFQLTVIAGPADRSDLPQIPTRSYQGGAGLEQIWMNRET